METTTQPTHANEGRSPDVGSGDRFGHLVVRRLDQALAAAREAQQADYRGYYPAATIVLAHFYGQCERRCAELERDVEHVKNSREEMIRRMTDAERREKEMGDEVARLTAELTAYKPGWR